MKKLVWYHILPLIFACFTLWFLYHPLLNLYETNSQPTSVSSKHLKEEVRFLTNYQNNVENELYVARSLLRKNQLTIFGSSELSGGKRPGLANNFLPDSLGIPVLAIGHGYHELFAIYCELLYFRPYLQGSKIHIVLSPGWFEDGKGTLPQSFLEYVPPHFITRIINDSSISSYHTNYLSKTYSTYYRSELGGKRLEYKYLGAKERHIPGAEKIKNSLKPKHKLVVIEDKKDLKINPYPNWEKWLNTSLDNSLKPLNKYHIDSSYFERYVSDKNGNLKVITVDPVPSTNNDELSDLKQVLQLMKENNCEVSFVMQPLHPQHYNSLSEYEPIMDSIDALMAEFGHTDNYLNLFVTNNNEYEPGILSDVMHFSDYGWMKVNQFLYERHFKK
ncbi:MAG: D-alanyl-lipoteichoic acid biosynthesis protein DltD [Flavobacteriales bacterium]